MYERLTCQGALTLKASNVSLYVLLPGNRSNRTWKLSWTLVLCNGLGYFLTGHCIMNCMEFNCDEKGDLLDELFVGSVMVVSPNYCFMKCEI